MFSESVNPTIMSPYERGYDYDYFAVVRYRSLRDFAENIDAMGEFFGESGMKTLKMSGIEYTHLVKVEMP